MAEAIQRQKNCSITVQKYPLTTTARCLRMFNFLTTHFKAWLFLSIMEELQFQTMLSKTQPRLFISNESILLSQFSWEAWQNNQSRGGFQSSTLKIPKANYLKKAQVRIVTAASKATPQTHPLSSRLLEGFTAASSMLQTNFWILTMQMLSSKPRRKFGIQKTDKIQPSLHLESTKAWVHRITA